MNNFNVNIKLLREAKKLSQAELGHIIGCSADLIYQIEKKGNPLKGQKLRNFLNYFNLSIEEFTQEVITEDRARILANNASDYDLIFRRPAEMSTPINEVVYENSSMVAEEFEAYTPLKKDGRNLNLAGKIIGDILSRHKTNRTQYAAERLNVSYRTLSRIVSGDIVPDIYTVMQIVEDHGESMDLFRKSPLPTGHWMRLLQEKDMLIDQQKSMLENLTEILKTRN